MKTHLLALLLLISADVGARESTHLEFHGGQDNASAPSSSSLIIDGALTIEAWVNYSGGGGVGPRIIEIIDSFNLHIDPYSDTLGFWLYSTVFPSDNGWTRVYDSTPMIQGEWVHVAGSWDGSWMRLFVNGSLVGSTEFTGPIYHSGPGDQSLKIGNGWTLIDGINAGIDEVRVSDVARYTGSFSPAEQHSTDSNTAGLWHFDENTGVIAFDESGHANHATILGASWVDAYPPYGEQILDYYNRVSGPESFYADATTPGYTVQGPYHGPVDVIVDGIWHNTPAEAVDAFYALWYDPPLYNPQTMTIGFDGCAWSQECDGQSIVTWMAFVQGLGFAGPGTVPDYRSNHEYHFVIDLGSVPVVPTIGVGDGGVYDNSGGLNVTLYQLEEIGVSTASQSWSGIKSMY